MSQSSYTSSERRGVLAIAVIALLIMCLGIGVSFCDRNSAEAETVLEVEIHPELIDTTVLKRQKEKSKIIKSTGRKPKPSSKSRTPKKYRRRSPLDEPV